MPSITVLGMNCEHCRKTVTEAVSSVPGVTQVAVSLAEKNAQWEDNPAAPANPEAVKAAILAKGFQVA